MRRCVFEEKIKSLDRQVGALETGMVISRLLAVVCFFQLFIIVSLLMGRNVL